jgi:hypothetical protein
MEFLKSFLLIIIVSLIAGKALSNAPEPDIIDFIPAQQTFIK